MSLAGLGAGFSSLVGDLQATAWLVLILVTPGAIAGLFWSPFLLSDRLRALFRVLPPRESWGWSYGLVILALSLPYVLGTIWALVQTTGETGGAMANAILDVVVPVSLLFVFGIPVLAVYVLPRADLDWDPEQYTLGTWALVFLGSLWFVLLFAVPLFVIIFFLALPM